MALEFVRKLNMSPGQRDTGDVIDADDINELQEALEGIGAGTVALPLAGIEGALGEWAADRAVVYGADLLAWDGVTDDTATLSTLAAQAVAASAVLALPPGTGMVTVFQPPSGLVMRGPGSNLCTIKQHASATGATDSVIKLWDKERVALCGFTIDGNRSAFGAVSTEWKHGIDALGSKWLFLDDVWATNTKGDGMFVGSGAVNAYAEDLTAIRCNFHHNYRNNLSIISLDRGVFLACGFTHAGGTAPEAGVDIEPDFNYQVTRDITFIACDFSDNTLDGWMVSMKPDGPAGLQAGIRVIGGAANRNGRNGSFIYRGRDIVLDGLSCSDNGKCGSVVADGTSRDLYWLGGEYSRNGEEGILIRNSFLPNIQTITITGSPTGGTYTLTFGAQTTSALAYNATRSQVKSALEALSNIATHDVILLGNRDNPIQLQLSGTWAGVAAPAITATPSLTGGSSPGITIAQERGSTYNANIIGVRAMDNGSSAPGTYNGVMAATDDAGGVVDLLRVHQCTIGNDRSTDQYRGVLVTAKVTHGSYWHNDLRGNTGAPIQLNDDGPARSCGENVGAGPARNVTEDTEMRPYDEVAVVGTISAPVTVTLPANPDMDRRYRIFDHSGNAATHTITVAPSSGHTIRNAPCQITSNYGSVELCFRSGYWVVVSEVA